MADVLEFYVRDDRKIDFDVTKPIMLEDNNVTDWRFHIPKTINGLDMSGWTWWLVYVNARGDKYTELLSFEYDYDRPEEFNVATYSVDYGMSIKAGSVKFALESKNVDSDRTVLNEWHTKTYSMTVVDTLQGNQVEYAETESDVISALLIEVQNKISSLVGGATPLPVSNISDMVDMSIVYVLTTDGNWYYYNGSAWMAGGQYGTIPDAKIKENIENWLDEHPEATTTVQDGAVTVPKLNTELYKAYLRTKTVMHFFPSLAEGGYSGNSSVIIADGKCVLFDCAPANNWDAVKAYYDALYADGIFTNIDYIIISHYHYDHIGNIEQILERYPHNGCVVYLPLDPTGYITGQDSVLTNRTAVIDTLESYDLEYHEVSADTEIDIAGELCKVSLFNSTAEDYTYYQSVSSDIYNNYSMCALVKTGEVYALYPGDIQKEAQIRILATKALPKLVLYSIHHHAIQNDDFLPYLDTIEPEYSVIQTNHTRGLISAASSFASNYASHNVYSCGYGSCVVAIGKDGGSVVEGVDLQKCGWAYSYVDLYIDNSYTGTVYDGTVDHPYVSVNEALMFIKDNLNLHYRLRVKATSETYDYIWVRDLKTSIEIIGQENGQFTRPIVDGVYLKNSNDVTLNKINITGTGREVNGISTLLYVMSSFAVIQNCVFNDSGNVYSTGVLINNGSVYVSGCTFKTLTNAFATYRWGTAISNSNTFDACTSAYLTNNLNLYIRNIDTVIDSTNYCYASGVNAKPITFPSLTSAAEVIALSALVALNSGRVLSRPFDCNGRMAVVRDNGIVYTDALSDTGTTISSNTNLNTLTVFGKYYCGNSATAQTLTNCPTTIGFSMFVERNASTYTRQTIYDNEGNMFIRTLTSGGTWNAWKTVTLT